jgi:hypothetical protein
VIRHLHPKARQEGSTERADKNAVEPKKRQAASAANVLKNVRLFFRPQRNTVGMARMR